jgi:hypothetical protein
VRTPDQNQTDGKIETLRVTEEQAQLAVGDLILGKCPDDIRRFLFKDYRAGFIISGVSVDPAPDDPEVLPEVFYVDARVLH